MKKRLIAALLVLSSLQISGQEVYKHLYESASQAMSDPATPESQVQINHFYVTALNYLKGTADKRMESVTTTFLDTQAYYLSEFVGAFFRDLSRSHKVSAECQHEVIRTYINASLDNPQFKDTDKETVQAFMADKNNLTPFSLDTDWEKAYKEAEKKIKKLKEWNN